MTTDYHDLGTCLATANPESRTICSAFEGQRIWFKMTVPPKARVWHALQKLLAATLGHPILRATVSSGGAESLIQEAERLRLFKARGFHVPDVLAVYDDMLVLSDAGPQFRACLDRTLERDARVSMLKAAMRSMADLHAAGLAHGRPYMRDMTWNNGVIGFLDLEEDPVKVMPLVTAQARDIWIFLSAASRYARRAGSKADYEDALICDLFGEYKKKADPAVLGELERFVLFLSPVQRMLDQKFLWKHIGTDARQSVFVNRCLEACLKRLCTS